MDRPTDAVAMSVLENDTVELLLKLRLDCKAERVAVTEVVQDT